MSLTVQGKFSILIQTGPEAHPASCKMDTEYLSQRWSGQGMTLTTHPLLGLRFMKEESCNSVPSYIPSFCVMGWILLFYSKTKVVPWLQPQTTEAQIRFLASLCGICDGQSGTGTGFSVGTSGFQSVSFHTCIYHQHYIISNRQWCYIRHLKNKTKGITANFKKWAHIEKRTELTQRVTKKCVLCIFFNPDYVTSYHHLTCQLILLIKTMVTPSNAPFNNLCILSVT
jgi:hypothetical protein